MFVYIANWAKNENEPRTIVDCDPWFGDGRSLNLKLTDRNGRKFTLSLDDSQVRQLVGMFAEESVGRDSSAQSAFLLDLCVRFGSREK